MTGADAVTPSSGESRPWAHAYEPRVPKPQMYPKFDLDEICDCVNFLDSEVENPVSRKIFGSNIFAYHERGTFLHYLSLRLMPATGLLVLICMVVLWRSLEEIADRSSQSLVYVVLFVSRAALSLIACLMIVGRVSWDQRFYLAVNKARKVAHGTTGSSGDLVYAVKIAGKAARSLFRCLQGRRITWVSPPAVADRALSLSFPLIDVSLDEGTGASKIHDTSRLYGEFLYYAAGLFVVRREDLIPKLREQYSCTVLPVRARPEIDEISERDALYLDPMRNYTRWGVAKDFFYPLATWISLLVAIAALVVSITK